MSGRMLRLWHLVSVADEIGHSEALSHVERFIDTFANEAEAAKEGSGVIVRLIAEQKLKLPLVAAIRKFMLLHYDLRNVLCEITDETRGMGFRARRQHMAERLAPLASASKFSDALMVVLVLTAELDLGVVSEEDVALREEWVRTLCLLAKWGACGCPRLRLSGRQFASFAFSDLAEAELDEWRTPWPALVIEIPDDIFADPNRVSLLSVAEHGLRDGERVFDVRVHTGEYNHKADVNYLALTPRVMHGISNAGLPVESHLDEAELECMVRIGQLCLRAVLNACVEASVASAMKPIKVSRQRRRGKHGKKRRVIADSKTTFELTREIRIDVTQYVRDYASDSKSRVRKCRWMVRGHRRNQACGKGWKDHRIRYIEPYMKGPECRPTTRRVHVLEDEDDGSDKS